MPLVLLPSGLLHWQVWQGIGQLPCDYEVRVKVVILQIEQAINEALRLVQLMVKQACNIAVVKLVMLMAKFAIDID